LNISLEIEMDLRKLDDAVHKSMAIEIKFDHFLTKTYLLAIDWNYQSLCNAVNYDYMLIVLSPAPHSSKAPKSRHLIFPSLLSNAFVLFLHNCAAFSIYYYIFALKCICTLNNIFLFSSILSTTKRIMQK